MMMNQGSLIVIFSIIKILKKQSLEKNKVKLDYDEKEKTCLSIGLVLKNYPKMPPDTLKSIHWIRSYRDFFFHVS